MADYASGVGIRLDENSTGNSVTYNSVTYNTMLNNGQFDAEDLSTGSGTAGTANTWLHNTERHDNHGGGLGHRTGTSRRGPFRRHLGTKRNRALREGIFSSEDPFRVFEYSRLASFMHEHSRELRKAMIEELDSFCRRTDLLAAFIRHARIPIRLHRLSC